MPFHFLEQAIENVKASAAGLSQENVPRTEVSKEPQNSKLSSTLPAGFVDDQNSKRQKIGEITISR